MPRPALCPITTVLWLAAVLGALAVMAGPLTPWCLPVELAGLADCVISSGALFAWFARRD